MSSPQSLANLQKALSMELSAVHQYQLHACVLDDWGMGLLASKMREEMKEELVHSEDFLNRILFLKGNPKLELQKTPVRATSLTQMFQTDLSDEKEALAFYTTASYQANDDRDLGTRQLFEKIAIDEEGHMSWLELQLELLEKIGEPAYIAKFMTVE